MARPREFCEDGMLDQAMQVFWRLGYEGCSINELTKATGLNRQSLYNVYIDKRGLFLAVLKRYQFWVDQSLQLIMSANATVRDIQKYYEDFLELQQSSDRGSCLMVKTAYGAELGDRQIKTAVEKSAKTTRDCFTQVVRRSQMNGSISNGTPPRLIANYLFGSLHGLSALSRTGTPAAEIRSAIKHIFSHSFLN